MKVVPMGDHEEEDRAQAWTSPPPDSGEEVPSMEDGTSVAAILVENRKLSATVLSLTKRLVMVEQRLQVPPQEDHTVVSEKEFAKTDEHASENHVPPKPPGDLLSVLNGLRKMITSSWIHVLLVTVPIALAGKSFSPVVCFVICLVAIIPLASLLGNATEVLSLFTSQTVGGLLNATFGNAVELIVGIVALKGGLLRVVQANMLGSILSNVLLVLGMSFVSAGIKFKSSKFNSSAAQASSSLLLLSVMAMTVPAALFLTGPHESQQEHAILAVSRFTAIVLLLIYGCYLVFQLKTHIHLFVDDVGDEEAEEALIPAWAAGLFLLGVTVVVSVVAENLVDSIEHVTHEWGISETFVGVIMLPLVGNAAEHATAVTVAYKDKMNLAIGVAVGSSIQIALMVMPLLVLVGWMIEQPLTFNFEGFETAVCLMSVIIVNAVIQDGESTWLEGVLLMSAYIILAASFFYTE